jgi:D-alanyl-D-alanine carboxypeptidase/D-alanyl-D-alanine-endopeptidase (penicillin-binding protein 4)
VAVLSGRTGATLYARSADRPLVSASNAKIFVLGAALSHLGPGYTFRTEALAAGPIEDGTLRGALVLRGSGDPSLTSEGLWGLAIDLEAAGLRRVEGDLILDDTAFAADQPPAAGPALNEAQPYGALTSALAANFNTIALEVVPGRGAGDAARVALVPPMRDVAVESRVRTGPAGSAPPPLDVAVARMVSGGGPIRVRVSGSLPAGEPSRRVWTAVASPASFTGALFKETLARADIAITGRARIAPAPPDARLLAAHESLPLGVLAREVGKRSSNLFAEQILKALSAETPRTTAGGLAQIRSWLASQGIRADAVRLVDGSGLSREDRATAGALARIFRAASRDPASGPEFLSAFGVAGVDGTLERRLPELRGRVRGKTGFLNGVVALTGWARTSDPSEPDGIFFTILVNGAGPDPSAAQALQDSVVRAIAGSSN